MSQVEEKWFLKGWEQYGD